MIYSDSRYADGVFVKAMDPRTKKTYPTVFRSFKNISSTFSYYVWVEEDRIDTIAQKFSSKPKFWEEILDINPEIDNPYSIAPGTVIRIPNSFTVG